MHLFQKKNQVQRFFKKAFDYAQNNDQIFLFGLKPQRAATEYGYIEYKQEKAEPFFVQRFHEKPQAELAQKYLEKNNMLWNIGMFAAKVSVFIKAFKIHVPDLFTAVQGYVNGNGLYEDVPAISVDYAVMEKSKEIMVFPVDFEWYDIGNVELFLQLRKKHEKQKSKP